jgi:hypothetical protein
MRGCFFIYICKTTPSSPEGVFFFPRFPGDATPGEC